MGLFFNIAKIQLKIAYIPLKKIVRISQYNIGTPHPPKLQKKKQERHAEDYFFHFYEIKFSTQQIFLMKKKIKELSFYLCSNNFFCDIICERYGPLFFCTAVYAFFANIQSGRPILLDILWFAVV